jgi:hypothetical protein
MAHNSQEERKSENLNSKMLQKLDLDEMQSSDKDCDPISCEFSEIEYAKKKEFNSFYQSKDNSMADVENSAKRRSRSSEKLENIGQIYDASRSRHLKEQSVKLDSFPKCRPNFDKLLKRKFKEDGEGLGRTRSNDEEKKVKDNTKSQPIEDSMVVRIYSNRYLDTEGKDKHYDNPSHLF